MGVALHRQGLGTVQRDAVVVWRQKERQDRGDGGRAGDGPEDLADHAFLLQHREEEGAEGGAQLAAGRADRGAGAPAGAGVDLRRDGHRRHAREALEGELDDVESVEEDNDLLERRVGGCEQQVGEDAADEADELHVLAGKLGQEPRREGQRGDDEHARGEHREDAVPVRPVGVCREDRSIVLFQAILDHVKEHPNEGRAEQWAPIGLEEVPLEALRVLRRVRELGTVLRRDEAEHEPREGQHAADKKDEAPEVLRRHAAQVEEVDHEIADGRPAARAEQV
mmetsp:Transcript_63685/g.176621  ORF Transcript_63685/g.176621 Transcript_63685/m.176621 type:complete len:281 (+) Transcript_63685:299-1141(+)